MMADYHNANTLLPGALIAQIKTHLPADSGPGVMLYFSLPFYPQRNQKIQIRFLELNSKGEACRSAIYDELAEEFSLSSRQICKIVKPARIQAGEPPRVARRTSGIRISRSEKSFNTLTVSKEGAYV